MPDKPKRRRMRSTKTVYAYGEVLGSLPTPVAKEVIETEEWEEDRPQRKESGGNGDGH